MIRPEIRVENGTAAVPEAPGLGVALDEEAVERFRIEPLSKQPYPALPRTFFLRSDGHRVQRAIYAHAQQYWDDFLGGRLPLFPEGVYLERIPDNGSREWKDLQARAVAGGFQTRGSL